MTSRQALALAQATLTRSLFSVAHPFVASALSGHPETSQPGSARRSRGGNLPSSTSEELRTASYRQTSFVFSDDILNSTITYSLWFEIPFWRAFGLEILFNFRPWEIVISWILVLDPAGLLLRW